MEGFPDKSLFRIIWRVTFKLCLMIPVWYTAIDLLIFFNLNRYNLYNLVDHFHNRGLYRSIFLR